MNFPLMMKHVLIALCLFIGLNAFPQHVTFVYRDTVVETNQLRFEIRICVAYRQFGKIILEITNLTDSFKIIYPKDISISDITGRQVTLQDKKPYVIPPKATRKCRFVAESNDFKAGELKVEIGAVHTTGPAVNVYAFPPFILDAATFDMVEKNVMPLVALGPVTLKLKNFKYYSKGNVRVWLSVFYSGDLFLGAHCNNISLKSADGKITMQAFTPRNNAFFFDKKRKELKLTLKFENPGSNAVKPMGEKLMLDNVFIEYPTYEKKDKISFKVYKLQETTAKVKEDEPDDEEKKEEEK